MNLTDLKISVITPVYNAETMIKHCMDSVARQTFPNKEHVIVDGLSTDKTVAVINNSKGDHLKLLSEKDNGLYDAFNKGMSIATGDIISFLGADDMFAHEGVLQLVANGFREYEDVDMIYGDIVYVDRDDLSKVVRYWKSSSFKPGLFRKGWMAPNTALFIKKDVFTDNGGYNLHYKMASDYELQFRLFEKHRLRSVYIANIMVRMRSGGVSNSSLRHMYKSLAECYAALSSHEVRLRPLYIFNTLLYRIRQTRIPIEVKHLNKKQVQEMSEIEVI